MIIDCNKYRHKFDLIIKLAETKPKDKLPEFIGELSSGTYVPVIVVAIFLAEAFGLTDELKRQIQLIKKFYKINSLINTTLPID